MLWSTINYICCTYIFVSTRLSFVLLLIDSGHSTLRDVPDIEDSEYEPHSMDEDQKASHQARRRMRASRRRIQRRQVDSGNTGTESEVSSENIFFK